MVCYILFRVDWWIWSITILFVGAVDHCVCISMCVADEVYSILLAEQGPFMSEEGQKTKL